jgi:hypothetical protein
MVLYVEGMEVLGTLESVPLIVFVFGSFRNGTWA